MLAIPDMIMVGTDHDEDPETETILEDRSLAVLRRSCLRLRCQVVTVRASTLQFDGTRSTPG